MTDIGFNTPAFRTQFPAYSNVMQYPDLTLQGYFGFATSYVSPTIFGSLTVAQRTYALNLMTAHIASLNDTIASGQVPRLVQSGTVDKVSYTTTPPPESSQFVWWLNLTGYGAQLAALLTITSTGGMYIGGYPEIGVFRKGAGFF